MDIIFTYTSCVNPHQGNGEISLPKPYAPADSWYFIKGLTGNTHPGAVLPFGKYSVLGYSGGYPCGCGINAVNSGFRVDKISEKPMFYGLSHLHQSGTGAIGVYYNYALTHPFFGDFPEFAPEPLLSEDVHPGVYRAETASVSCAASVSKSIVIHHWHFKKDGPHGLAVDFANDGLYSTASRLRGASSGTVTVCSDRVLAAEMLLSGVTLYFRAEITGGHVGYLFSGTQQTEENTLTLDTPETDRRAGGVFWADDEDCTVRLSISARSAEHAEQLLLSDTRTFDEIAADAEGMWETMLSRIEIETDDAREREIFYSNLYHTLVKPCDWSGEAFLFENREQTFVSDVATMWDIYKTQLPLLFSVYPEISEKLLSTFTQYGREFGFFPHCLILSSNRTIETKQARMLAEYAVCDAFWRGVKADYPALLALSEQDGARYTEFFTPEGCPSASHTLDMAEAYTSLSKVAAALGDRERAERFASYGKKAAAAFDADGLMRADSDYYEGNRYNYSFRPLHDSAARIASAGKEALTAEALRFFGFTQPDDKSSRFEGYNNETDMEAPAFLHELGFRDRMCEVIRAGIDCMFTTGIGGIPGNADSGGLTACYLWNALGLFPVSGQDRYILGTPRYRKAVLHQPGGDLIILRTGGESIYPASVSFNGQNLPDFEIAASKLRAGGELVFVMR